MKLPPDGYLEAVVRISGAPGVPDGVYLAQVRHEPSCELLSHRGPACTCDRADVRLWRGQ